MPNMNEKSGLAKLLAMQGRGGDTLVAHINPMEARMLKAMGGSGTVNPKTGLLEFWGVGDGSQAGTEAGGGGEMDDFDPTTGQSYPDEHDVSQTDFGPAGVDGGDDPALVEKLLFGKEVKKNNKGFWDGIIENIFFGAFKPTVTQVGRKTAGYDIGRGLLDLTGVMMSPVTGLGKIAVERGLEALTPTTTVSHLSPEERAAFDAEYGKPANTPDTPDLSGDEGGIDERLEDRAIERYLVNEGLIPAESTPEEDEGISYRQWNPEYPTTQEGILRIAEQGGDLPHLVRARTGGGLEDLIDEKGRFNGMVKDDGSGDGMSDNVIFPVKGDPEIKEAHLSPDEYVIDAHTVAALGNGSSDKGADVLDNFVAGIRKKAYNKGKQPKQLNGIKELAAISKGKG